MLRIPHMLHQNDLILFIYIRLFPISSLYTAPQCGFQMIKAIYYHTINCSEQVAYAVFTANKIRIYCNVCTQRAD